MYLYNLYAYQIYIHIYTVTLFLRWTEALSHPGGAAVCPRLQRFLLGDVLLFQGDHDLINDLVVMWRP